MRSTSSPFKTDFYLWNGVSAIFYSNNLTGIHSHNTLQLIVDIQDRFRCRTGDGGWQSYKNFIIKEDIPHQLDTNGSVQLIIYLDTATTAAKKINARYLQNKDAAEPELILFDLIRPDELQLALLKPDPVRLHHIISRIIHTLTGNAPTRSDDRIRATEHLLATIPPADRNISYLSRQVHLSPSRLRSLFRQQTGVPLYKYILWSRIRYAINRIMAGHPVNDAAWSAGFTDNSHFHKILVNMFGISPSQFLRDRRTMAILTCDQSPLLFETFVYDTATAKQLTYFSTANGPA